MWSTRLAAYFLLAPAVCSLAACTSSGKGADPTPTPITGKLPPSRATLTLGNTAIPLYVMNCVETSPRAISVSAQTEEARPATLVLSLLDPVSASTMVYTTRKKDNSFTQYAVAAGQLTQGSVDGSKVVAEGDAVKQKYTPKGKLDGKAGKVHVLVDITCTTINQPTQAPG